MLKIEQQNVAQKSTKSNEWYTPGYIIEAAREVMGGIELDPASCALAQETVRADRYYSREDDGLSQEWRAKTVWLNPPFGKTNNQSNIGLFVSKLLTGYREKTIHQAIILVHSKNTDRWFSPLWDFPICFADHHVQFNRPDGQVKDQMFGICFVYLGPDEQKFIEVFSRLGTVAKRVS